MRTSMDDLISQIQSEQKELQGKLNSLEQEQGVLRDTIADEQKWETHPAARERLEEVSGEITGVRGEIDMKEQGIALAENAKQVLAQQEEGPRQAGHGSEVPANAAVEAFQERTETGEVWKEAAENVVKVEAPIAMTVALHDPQPQVFSADHTPTVDLGIALVMGVAAGGEIYKALKEQSENRGEADQPVAEALHSKQLTEMEGLKADLKFQKEAAQEELDKLGLNVDNREKFCKNEFDASVQRTNDMLARHDQERAELGSVPDDLASKMQTERYDMSRGLCQDEATREVSTFNETLVQSYTGGADISSWQATLAASAPQEIEAKTETLHQEKFPEIARDGPGIEGPAPATPAVGGPDIGSGPDRNDM